MLAAPVWVVAASAAWALARAVCCCCTWSPFCSLWAVVSWGELACCSAAWSAATTCWSARTWAFRVPRSWVARTCPALTSWPGLTLMATTLPVLAKLRSYTFEVLTTAGKVWAPAVAASTV